jgi:hypothetical protein
VNDKRKIKPGDKFGRWQVVAYEYNGNGEDEALIQDTESGFGEFYVPVHFLETLNINPEHVKVRSNFHERFADIVRRLAEWKTTLKGRDFIKGASELDSISGDAVELWAEYQENPK